MLNHYAVLLELAYQRQQDMFRQAGVERLYRQLQGNRATLLQRVGYHLLAAIRCLEAYLQPKPARPILSEK